MSCVLRTGQRYGPAHVVDVLRGEANDRVRERCHDKLSTFGLIPDQPKPVVMRWIDQLVDQGLLDREPEFRVLSVTPAGWEVLRSNAEAKLSAAPNQVPEGRRRGTRRHRTPAAREGAGCGAGDSPSRSDLSRERKRVFESLSPQSSALSPVSPPAPLDVDALKLFESLRQVRREIAEELGVPAFVVFSDKTLRELACARPETRGEMMTVKGVGEAKWESFGPRFLETIRTAAASIRG
jgi:ATP-dependent DNA helicase RecQ